jgi:hypothetical protein
MMASSSPEQESDPPPEQESRPQSEQESRPQSEQEFSRPLTAVNRSLCWGHSPTAEEIYGTTEGDNARRLLQAREDEDLQIHHREPRHAALPHHDLYDVLPPPTRDLHTSAHYILNHSTSKAHGAKYTTRVGVAIAVATTTRYLPRRDAKNIMSGKHNNRAIFRLDYIKNLNDFDMIQFLSSVIGNICARCEYCGFDLRGSRVLYIANIDIVPSQVVLGKMDLSLKNFIISTAFRHAGEITPLPAIRLMMIPTASNNKGAAVETTVAIMHRESLVAAPQVNSMPIRLDLQRVSQAGSTLVSPIFSLPERPTYLNSSWTGGYDKATQNRAFEALCWISAHTHGKVFEVDSFPRFVEYLTSLACLGSADQQISADGGLYGGHDLFIVSSTESGSDYSISPGPQVLDDIVAGYLPDILVCGKLEALLRAIERLETAYLTTGSFESAWEACCHRADFETQMVEDGEYLPEARCACRLPERHQSVHCCDICGQSLLCADNASVEGAAVELVCADCYAKRLDVPASTPANAPANAPTETPADAPTETPADAPTETPTDAPSEARGTDKCHACYVSGFRCKKTDPSQPECNACLQLSCECKKLEYGEDGLPPLTQNEQRAKVLVEAPVDAPSEARGTDKCHACYVYARRCKKTDLSQPKCDFCLKNNKTCKKLERGEDGLPPLRYNEQRANDAPGEVRGTDKCHACYVSVRRCRKTDPNQPRCDFCLQRRCPCKKLERGEDGLSPLTKDQKQKQRADAPGDAGALSGTIHYGTEKCHACYANASTCRRSHAKQEKCYYCIKRSFRCQPIKRVDGELPARRHTRDDTSTQGIIIKLGTEKCHECYADGSECKTTSAEPKNCGHCIEHDRPCRPIEYLGILKWDTEKCHGCYTSDSKCHRASADQEDCDHCVKTGKQCRPIEPTDEGELPRTVREFYKYQRYRHRAESSWYQTMRGELTAALTTQPQTDQEKAEAVSSEANRQHDELRKKWCDELDQ